MTAVRFGKLELPATSQSRISNTVGSGDCPLDPPRAMA